MAGQKKRRNKKQETDILEEILSLLGKGFISLFQFPIRLLAFAIILASCLWAAKQDAAIAKVIGMEASQVHYGVYLVFLVPVMLLLAFGASNNAIKSMAEKFESIQFTNKAGQHPIVKSTYRDRRDRRIKIIEFYAPGIPLLEWQRRKDDIESALDCTILMMKRDADSRQMIVVKTVSSNYKIPKKVNWDDQYIPQEDFALSLGEGLLGPIKVNLNQMPHAIVAGTTGSGKSVTLRYLLWQSIKKGARVYIVDFKGGVEFDRRWEDFAEVVTEQLPALDLLKQLVMEMKERLTLFRSKGVKNLTAYNQKYMQEPICHIVFACDELAELMDKEGVTNKEEKQVIGEIERCITSLARLARAAGIHMLLGMQRPDAKVLKGQIKNNAPIRICGRAEAVLSDIVLGTPKASELSEEEQGRFYCNISGLSEFQGYWFEDSNLVDGDYQVGQMLTNGKKLQEPGITIDDADYQEFEVPKQEQAEWEADLELTGIQV